jgi:hypothetical protein
VAKSHSFNACWQHCDSNGKFHIQRRIAGVNRCRLEDADCCCALSENPIALCRALIHTGACSPWLGERQVGMLAEWQTLQMQIAEVRMVPLQIEQVVARDVTPREGLLERMEGALLLTSLAAVTVGWCCLLALMIWRGFFWIFDLA